MYCGYKISIYSKLNNYEHDKNELNSHDKELIEQLFKEDLENSDISFKSLNNKNKSKKLQLNIFYYDESLKDNEENSDNCTFLQTNINKW